MTSGLVSKIVIVVVHGRVVFKNAVMVLNLRTGMVGVVSFGSD